MCRVPRYALEYRARVCTSTQKEREKEREKQRPARVYPGRRGRTSKRGRASGRWKRVWDFYGLASVRSLSLPVSFRVASGSRGVCGCREQLVVEKHPRSLSRHPLSTLLHRHRAPGNLSSTSFPPHPPAIPRRIAAPTSQPAYPG